MGGSESACPDGVNVTSPTSRSWAATTQGRRELPDPGGPTIHIKLISIMGGADVKRGRKLSRAERKALKHSGH